MNNDQELILKTVQTCPPDRLLIKCRTNFQRDIWLTSKEVNFLIYSELKSYFTGQESVINADTPEGKLAKSWSNFYFLFYECLWRGWKQTKEEINKISQKYARQRFNTPGQLLSFFITLDSQSDLDFIFNPYLEFSARKYGDVLRGDPNSTNKKHLALRKKYKEFIVSPHDEMRTKILQAIKKNSKNDRLLKNRLKEFWSHNVSMIGDMSAQTHPRKALKKFVLQHGEVSFPSAK